VGLVPVGVKLLGVEVGETRGPWRRRGAFDLPAEVGWPMFLRLWARRNVSLRVPKEGGQELLRVEVLEARADGTANGTTSGARRGQTGRMWTLN